MQPRNNFSVIVGVVCFLAAGPAFAAADLRVVIPAPAAQHVYDETQYAIAVTNIGNQTAAAVKLTIDLPATQTSPTKYVMGTLAGVDPRCTLAGTRLTCLLGSLGKKKGTTVSFRVAFPVTTAALTVSAAVTTSSAENGLANNSASDVPTQIHYAVAVTDGDLAVNSHCTGTALTSYFECEKSPGSVSSHEVVFHGDGTLSFPEEPGYGGTWTQDAGDSLAFTYTAGGEVVAEFVGYGSSPGCFEGVTEFPGSTYVSPYEVCL